MNKYILSLLAVLCLAIVVPVSISIASPDPSSIPTTWDEIIDVSQSLIASVRAEQYRAVAAWGIVILLFLWRRFFSVFLVSKLNKWWLTWLTALFGVLAALPVALLAESFSWTAFIFNGFIISAQAMAFWLLIGKRVLPKVFGDITDKKETTCEMCK